jgi:hypothetical protein
MAIKLDAKELVTFRDAILTEAIQFAALVKLPIKTTGYDSQST